MTLPAANRIIPRIVEQHAEEAAFLWLLRDRAVDAAHYARRHLASLEERIEAHLDGLRVAGEAGFEIALAQLDRHPEAGEAFAVAALALGEGGPRRLEPVLEVARSVPATRRGLFTAIGWTPIETLGVTVRSWLDAEDPLARLLGVVACSLHRVDPGPRLPRLLDDSDAEVRARACRLAGEVGRDDLRETVAAREDAAPWSAWAAALLGDGPAIGQAARQVAAHGPSLELAARQLDLPAATAWIRALNGDPAQRCLVVRALGALGDPAAVPWLIARMAEPEFARVAGESFALITGVDLEDEKLEAATSGLAETGPSDDPAEEDVAPDPDEDLPWPDPARVAAWWQEHGGRFPCGTRHLLGRPADEEACTAAWRHGSQRQRRAAAYEQAALRPGTPLRNWRARIVRARGDR